ncbi:hypothetical protein [uncultured Aquimarina sp.]|uniref:hypothetical protein n=1 Tax=uncultured Aquimarina sp. TaxID=575652 RepID=UPI002632327F|nr:hypothetical protein [uncultured Aquimarina sp.]
MKTEKIILFVFSLFVIGCSTDELEKSLILEKDLNTNENLSKGIVVRGNNSSNCTETNQIIKIIWKLPITDSEKNDVRIFFEQDYGKHPLVAIDPNGINETWTFNLSIIPLEPILNDSGINDCPRANDVVKAAVTEHEEIELDD